MNTILHDTLQSQLQKVEARLYQQVADNYAPLATALEGLITTGGKRVRPRVTLLMGGLLGADQERLFDLAAAIEMLHTATLVHDDLIDGALLRRGADTLHTRWTPATTVLAGDLVFALAARLAAASDSVQVMALFSETLQIIVNGELTNLLRPDTGLDRQAYYDWIYAKTASMFELATGGAALLSQANAQQVTAARTFGRGIGMAFQIVDDILDYTGKQAQVGKPVGHDLRQGVVTLPAFLYFEACPDDPTLQSILQRNGHSEAELDQLVYAIRQSPAIEQALLEARQHVQLALEALRQLPDAPERLALEELAKFIVERKT